ncbi:hypothetical protein ACFWZ7_24860 [Nocardiopsis alba]|uniref:hypothetical protein n=1 Tax=Nocardiopsis alba TaxID=53437 RepID=UPI003672AFCB
MSALEKRLKRIVDAHPRARVAPHSPSGPYVRAVLWQAPGLLGQVVWEPDAGRWTVRARLLTEPDRQVAIHPATEDEIPTAITTVINHIGGA